MKIVILSIGKIIKDHIKADAAKYVKQIKRYSPLEIIEIKKETVVSSRSTIKILENIHKGNFVIAPLSLSQLTLPHELVRLVLLEQIYWAFTILRNEPYSH